ARLYQKIKDSYFEIAKALAQAIEAKDPYYFIFYNYRNY
ncbi:unnamed protein product, partial [marine sediment metagenome]